MCLSLLKGQATLHHAVAVVHAEANDLVSGHAGGGRLTLSLYTMVSPMHALLQNVTLVDFVSEPDTVCRH